MVVLGVLLSVLVGHVTGYSAGPPSERCGNMVPGHDAEPRMGPALFEVTFSKSDGTYSENEQIEVTIQKLGLNGFNGFLIQPRPNADTYRTYGTISNFPSGTRNPCENEGLNRDAALSHSSGTIKSSVTFTWTAPDSDVGDIVFVFTIVQDYSVFWVKLTSDVLTYRSRAVTNPPQTVAPTQPTQPPTAAPTAALTEPPSNSPTGKIVRDPACGVTKGCFLAPPTCTTDCDSLVSWRVSGSKDVEFTLQKKTTDNNHWIAVGFSDDPRMGNDSVAQCVAYDGAVDVRTSFNIIKYKNNEPLDYPNFGVTLTSGSFSSGVLSCTFLRKKNVALASGALGRRRRADTDEKSFFDLSEKWYLLVAHGTAHEGELRMHTDKPKISMEKIDFLTVTTETVTKPTLVDVGTVQKESGCGESMGCFHDCDSSGVCGFLLMWKDNGDDIDLTLKCNRGGSNNVYCAIGLSSDDKMGDDSVMECVSSGNQVSVTLSYNDGKNNYRLNQAQFGLSKMSGTYVDGILTCTFSRKKTAGLASSAGGHKKRAVDPSASTYFDMNSDWNLFYAYGTAIGGFINKHEILPTVSSEKADFQSFMDVSAGAVEKPLIKVHGILMILAWMFFATLGIFSARFYKSVWPEGMEWCGLKRWFVIHRFCMVVAFLLTAVSFIVIFVHVGGYAEIEGSNFDKSHPIIGIVVMCLAVINPIMALFRPHPGTPRRPVFNVAHKVVGVSASVCSIVNIFSGTALAAAAVPSNNRIVLWIYVGWIIALDLIMYSYDLMNKKGQDEGTSPILGYNTNRQEAYELKQPSGEMVEKARQVSLFKVFVLVLYLLVLLSLAIAVCTIVGLAGEGHHDHDH